MDRNEAFQLGFWDAMQNQVKSRRAEFEHIEAYKNIHPTFVPDYFRGADIGEWVRAGFEKSLYG